MSALFWWIKMLVILIGSILFLIFGIGNLLSAYYLSNPQEFIVLFFSSSLMILISITGFIYVVFRFAGLVKKTSE